MFTRQIACVSRVGHGEKTETYPAQDDTPVKWELDDYFPGT